MKKTFFKGYPVYLPDQVELDDVITVVHGACARASLQVDTWKENDIDVAQVNKAGQYAIKWLNGQASIYIHPDVAPYRVRKAPTEWSDLWEFRPVLAIKLCDETQYWPRIPGGAVYSELIVPSEESSLYWPEDRTSFEYVKDAEYHLPQLHHVRHTELEHVGEDVLYSSSNTVENYTPADSGIIFSDEFSYIDHWDAYGNHFILNPLIFGGRPYTDKDRCTVWTTTKHRYIKDEDGTVLVSGGYNTVRNYELEFVENYKIPDDLYNDMWPEELIAQCVYNPGTYRVYDRDQEPAIFTGSAVYLEVGEAWTDANGQRHTSFLWHEYRYGGGSNYETYRFNLTVDGHTWTLKSAGYDPYDPPDDIYAFTCAIYQIHGMPVTVYSYLTFPDSGMEEVNYGIVWKGAHYQTPPFDNDKGWLEGNWNRHDVFGIREQRGVEGYGDCMAIGIEEFSETVYHDEVNEEHLYFNDD